MVTLEEGETLLASLLKGTAPVIIFCLALFVFSDSGRLVVVVCGALLLLWLIIWLPLSAVRLFRMARAHRLEMSEYERKAFGFWLGAFVSGFVCAALFPFAVSYYFRPLSW